MNRENLMRMADFIQTIPQQEFSMNFYRKDRDELERHCGTVGCVIGHCTALDTDKNFALFCHKEHDRYEVNFMSWSESFTDMLCYHREWQWCFGSSWTGSDNTPIGAAKRIMYLLKHGLPEDWRDQMLGRAPLCYLEIGLQTPVSSKTLLKSK